MSVKIFICVRNKKKPVIYNVYSSYLEKGRHFEFKTKNT